ncbi:MAG: hypothetical protein A2Y17_08105 [Clostridiales bacterium GWF2_38_85]|nr:MAG: hypothetical protein A2Y17_08105 [Clostridiales bacterium GWF2_38_85]HBL83845.1 hypothetical protein [Clostridiales bacterium]
MKKEVKWSDAYNMRGLIWALFGELFVLVDFKVISGNYIFDIVPDFVGYILIAIGISELMKYDKKYKWAVVCSGFLFTFTILETLMTLTTDIYVKYYTAYHVICLVDMLIELLMIYFIISASAVIAKKCDEKKFAKFLNAGMIYILAVRIAIYLIEYVARKYDILILTAVITVMQFAFTICIVILFSRIYMDLDGVPAKLPEETNRYNDGGR